MTDGRAPYWRVKTGDTWVSFPSGQAAFDAVRGILAGRFDVDDVQIELVAGRRTGWGKILYRLLGLDLDLVDTWAYVERHGDDFAFRVIDPAGGEYTLADAAATASPVVGLDLLLGALKSFLEEAKVPGDYTWNHVP